jgi:hypothetical protein
VVLGFLVDRSKRLRDSVVAKRGTWTRMTLAQVRRLRMIRRSIMREIMSVDPGRGSVASMRRCCIMASSHRGTAPPSPPITTTDGNAATMGGRSNAS